MALKDLSVRFTSDTTGLDKGFQKAESGITNLKSKAGSLQQTGQGLTGLKAGIMDLATGLTFAAGALLTGIKGVSAFGGQCIGLASDLNEVQNVVDVTFGNNASKINQFAQTSDKSFGIAELAAKRYSGTLGAMFKSAGVASNNISTMSTKLTGLAGDLASFYNLSTDEAFQKIQSGIAGEVEPLRMLGINMSQTNLQAFAMANGIKVSVDKMSEGNQMLLRYAYLLSVTSDAQGDFARTNSGWANQSRMLSMNWQTFMASIGKTLLPVLLPILQGLNGIVQGLTSVVNWFGGLNSTAKTFLGTGLVLLTLIPLLTIGIYGIGIAIRFFQSMAAIATASTVTFASSLMSLLGWIGVIIMVLGALFAIFGGSGPSTKAATDGLNSTNGAMSGTASDAKSASGAIDGLTKSTKGLGKAAKGLSLAGFDQINQLNKAGGGGGLGIGINQGDLAKTLADIANLQDEMNQLKIPDVTVPSGYSGFLNLLGGIAKPIANLFGFGDTWQLGWDTIMNSAEPIKTFFKGLWDMLSSGFQYDVDAIGKFFTDLWNDILWHCLCTKTSIQAAWDAVSKWFSDLISGIGKFFTDFWNDLSWHALCAKTSIQAAWEDITAWFSNLFTSAWNGIKTAWSAVGTWFSGIWTSIKSAFSTAGTWFSTTFSDAWKKITEAFSSVGTFFTGIWNSITGIFSNIGSSVGNAVSSAFKTVVNGILSGAESVVNWCIDAINKLIDAINSLPLINASIGHVKHISITRLERGTVVDSPTIAEIGEHGKEVLMPLENNTGWISELAQKILSLQGRQPAAAGNTIVPVYLDGALIYEAVVSAQDRDNIKSNGKGR